ncbi:MAG: hypothetical protein PVF68_12270 [Acidobacteriota bacterium]|jgi:hypothetical protein
MRRWLIVTAVVIAFLALAVAVLIKVALEEPPGYARVPAIQERFADAIATLADLARSVPIEGCGGHDSPQDLLREVERLEGWWKEVEAVSPAFEDPAILGAEVVFECGGGTTSTIDVKRFDNPDGAWSGALLRPSREYPATTVWHDGSRRLIRYEDRVPVSKGAPRILRLTFDPEALEPG